jgi:alkylhydroperoxidase family enzyme
MAFIRLAGIDELEGTPRDVAESGQAQYGKVLETWKAIMNKPDMFATYLPFLRTVAGPGEMDAQLKDVCALYVGYLNHCRYTTSHRATSAAAKGITDDEMRLVVRGEWEDLPESWQAALELTRELTLNPQNESFAGMPQAATPATLAGAQKHFSDVELLELCMTIAMWNALSRFHRVMDFDLDMPDAPKGVKPE